MSIGIFFTELVENDFGIRHFGVDFAGSEIFPEGFDQFADLFPCLADKIGKFDQSQTLGLRDLVFREIVVPGMLSGDDGVVFAHLLFDKGVTDT